MPLPWHIGFLINSHFCAKHRVISHITITTVDTVKPEEIILYSNLRNCAKFNFFSVMKWKKLRPYSVKLVFCVLPSLVNKFGDFANLLMGRNFPTNWDRLVSSFGNYNTCKIYCGDSNRASFMGFLAFLSRPHTIHVRLNQFFLFVVFLRAIWHT